MPAGFGHVPVAIKIHSFCRVFRFDPRSGLGFNCARFCQVSPAFCCRSVNLRSDYLNHPNPPVICLYYLPPSRRRSSLYPMKGLPLRHQLRVCPVASVPIRQPCRVPVLTSPRAALFHPVIPAVSFAYRPLRVTPSRRHPSAQRKTPKDSWRGWPLAGQWSARVSTRKPPHSPFKNVPGLR